MYRVWIKVFLFLLLQCITFGAIAEVSESQDYIKTIKVVGNKRTDTSTIIAYTEFSEGGKYSKKASEVSLTKLYATGFFSEVKIRFYNHVVTIYVDENPIIKEIHFSGNNKLKKEVLLNEMGLKPRMFLSKAKLQNDVRKIVELYDKSGRYFTVVTPKIAKLPQNRVDILFDIKEGEKLKIKKIVFVGNKRFSGQTLRSAIMSKEDRWYHFFKPDYYDSDMVEYDKVLLSRFYTQHGYANFKVISAVADILPSKDGFYLTFTIEEGAKYKFGDIKIRNPIKNIKTSDLESLIAFKKDQTFNSVSVDSTINSITKYFANHGFPFVKVVPEYSLDENYKLVNVVFRIAESMKIYIGRININGNLKTYDYVIRREFRLAEGDPYNAFLINRSEQRLKNLDFFEKTKISTQPTDESDVVDLNVDVEEKSTANIKFSVGYSTTDGPLGMITLVEKNLFGRGQHFHAKVQKSPTTFGVGTGLTQPNFVGSSVDAGFSVGYNKEDNHKSSLGADSSSKAYNSEFKFGSVFISYDIIEALSHTVTYSLNQEDISGIRDKTPVIVKEQTGKNVVSSIGHDLTYNLTDSPIKPTSGYIVSLGQTAAGLGGTSKYLKNVLMGSYFHPLWNDIVLKLGGNVGYIRGLGKSVRVSENFYLGDQSFKGFESAGIGPRDKASRDSLGGKFYYKGTVEAMFPVPGVPRDLDFSGAVFSDFGSNWGVDLPKGSQYKKSDFYDTHSVRVSVGTGIIWITSMGPLRLDFSKAVKKEHFDKTRTFLFSFSAAL